jgi:hypothetical protein
MASVAVVPWGEAAFEAAVRELLRALPTVRLRVSGGCMAPAIPEGATVLLERPGSAPPRFGDVVLARHAEGLRLHRLVWAPRGAGRAWRTQADRAPLFDRRLRREDVLATVVKVEGRSSSPRRASRASSSLLRSLVRCLRLRGPRAG